MRVWLWVMEFVSGLALMVLAAIASAAVGAMLGYPASAPSGAVTRTDFAVIGLLFAGATAVATRRR